MCDGSMIIENFTSKALKTFHETESRLSKLHKHLKDNSGDLFHEIENKV